MTAYWVVTFFVSISGILAYGIVSQIKYNRKLARDRRLEQIEIQWRSFPDQPRYEEDKFIWWYLTKDGWKAFWVF